MERHKELNLPSTGPPSLAWRLDTGRLDNKVSVTAPGDVQVLISEHFWWKFITLPSYCTFHTFFFTESEKSKWLRSKKKQLSEVGDLALYHLMSVCTVPTLWETRGQLIMLPVVLWSPGQREASGDWIMYNEGGVYSERLNTGPQHCLLHTLYQPGAGLESLERWQEIVTVKEESYFNRISAWHYWATLD